MELNLIGRTLIIFGVVLIIVGTLLTLGGKIPWLGKLPGDIYVQKKHFSFYFPLTTCLLISLIITLVLWLIVRR